MVKKNTPINNQSAIDAAISQIEKQFGMGSIMRFGSMERQSVDVIPTGSLALDAALGVGGIPRGRITEIYGSESAGKSTLCQHILAEAQKAGGKVAYIDVEQTLDPAYAKACGLDIDEMYISQPDTGEQALQIAEHLINSGAITCVIVDSVAALLPKAEIEGEIGDSYVGVQARLMSQALRKLAGAVNRTNTALIFTNQLREKIGFTRGNPEIVSGGKALKYYASVRLDVRKIETLLVGDSSSGIRSKVKVVKNKVAPPFRVAEFDITFGEGISREGDILDIAVEHKLVDKAGAWYSYGETRVGQGREQSKEYLRNNPEVLTGLENQLRHKLFGEEL
jgi:recombination protein RecA